MGGSCSQAPFCLYTRRLISVQPEETFARLCYLLGGLRPTILLLRCCGLTDIHHVIIMTIVMVVSIVYFWLQSVSKERGEFLRLVKNEVMQAPSAVFSLSNYEVCGQKLFTDSSDTMTQVAMHLTFTMLCHQRRVSSLS